MNLGSVACMDWQSTAEGETILQHFYNPQTFGRKIFGILERPAVPPSVEEVSYKLFVTGKAGIGKTATISRLAGTKCASSYFETLGIHKTNVYWPVKIWDKVIMFKLQFWEAGDNSLRKYGHILSACQSKADAILFIFSFTDKTSFTDLPLTMNRLIPQGERPTSIAIGTRYNTTTALDVNLTDIKEFEIKYQVPVLKIENKWLPERNEVHEVAPLLNIICERLWNRDQEYLLKQGLAR